MTGMKRSWTGLTILVLLLPACQSGGKKAAPQGPQPLPELLRPYEGALRVLPARGDEKTLALKAGQALVGACDVAVRVRSVAYDGGSARFALETVGRPRVGQQRGRCKQLLPGMQLSVAGLPAGPVTAETTARLDELLLTAEAYLRRKGTSFDREAGQAPTEVASQLADAGDDERRLARGVTAWPRPLLSVDALYRDASGRGRHERLVALEAVVGSDGRVYRPQVKAAIDRGHQAALESALGLWRFEPARRAEGPVGARVAFEAVLRVY
jgi:hypothetical protein